MDKWVGKTLGNALRVDGEGFQVLKKTPRAFCQAVRVRDKVLEDKVLSLLEDLDSEGGERCPLPPPCTPLMGWQANMCTKQTWGRAGLRS